MTRREKSNDYYWDEPGRRDITVIEEMQDRDTGLVDQYGCPIYRQKNPCGFDLSQRASSCGGKYNQKRGNPIK